MFHRLRLVFLILLNVVRLYVHHRKFCPRGTSILAQGLSFEKPPVRAVRNPGESHGARMPNVWVRGGSEVVRPWISWIHEPMGLGDHPGCS